VDYHLPAADHRHASYFAWIQPANVDIRPYPSGKIERDKDHILDTRLDIGIAPSDDLFWHGVEPVTQDRKIVWSKIPQRIHITLQTPHVQSLGVYVIDLT